MSGLGHVERYPARNSELSAEANRMFGNGLMLGLKGTSRCYCYVLARDGALGSRRHALGT